MKRELADIRDSSNSTTYGWCWCAGLRRETSTRYPSATFSYSRSRQKIHSTRRRWHSSTIEARQSYLIYYTTTTKSDRWNGGIETKSRVYRRLRIVHVIPQVLDYFASRLVLSRSETRIGVNKTLHKTNYYSSADSCSLSIWRLRCISHTLYI
jgi:hypothetical protein